MMYIITYPDDGDYYAGLYSADTVNPIKANPARVNNPVRTNQFWSKDKEEATKLTQEQMEHVKAWLDKCDEGAVVEQCQEPARQQLIDFSEV